MYLIKFSITFYNDLFELFFETLSSVIPLLINPYEKEYIRGTSTVKRHLILFLKKLFKKSYYDR